MFTEDLDEKSFFHGSVKELSSKKVNSRDTEISSVSLGSHGENENEIMLLK